MNDPIADLTARMIGMRVPEPSPVQAEAERHQTVDKHADNVPPPDGAVELRLYPHDAQVTVHFGDSRDVAETFANWADDEHGGMWGAFRRHLASIHPTQPNAVAPDADDTRPDLVPAPASVQQEQHEFNPQAVDQNFCAHITKGIVCDRPKPHHVHI
jgi:hypothetical protein